MAKRILRSFLYLDDETVSDYLSQLEGGMLDGSFTEKISATGGREGIIQAGFQGLGVSGKAGKSTSSDVEQTIIETPGAKFTRLYDHLETDKLIQPLNGFDQGAYDQLEAGELVEIRGRARLTKWDKILEEWDSYVRMAEIMKQMGQDPSSDPTMKQMLEIMPQLRATGQEETPLVVTPLNAPSFHAVVVLQAPPKMKKKKSEFEREVTILGKIQRKLEPCEKIDVFRLVSRFDTIQSLNQQSLNRSARRQSSKKSSAMITDSPFDEVVEYPALEITPIAVYI